MKTAVFIVCLVGMACALPYSSESHSKSTSDSHSDSSSSSEERFRTAPTANTATVQSIITEDFQTGRGDSLRRRRALKSSSESSIQDTNSVESHPDSSSSSEEVGTAPTPDETTLVQARGDSRRRRDLGQVAHGSSSQHSEESATTESTSHQSHPSASSEEDSHEHSTRKNLLQGILGLTTADPDTSEESSEERTTVFQP
ncbi:uncharacterized protein [Dendropsophus ebraccatus]|uniref:uncharacterized protein n=1 Tax=Dendropsophus ebraccatus TaxID=150705 RepID=UPI0038316452